MHLQKIKIQGYKNLNCEIDFSDAHGVALLIGSNGSGKSNILEAMSLIFGSLYDNKIKINFNYTIEYELEGKQIKIDHVYSTNIAVGRTGSLTLTKSQGAKGRILTFIVDGQTPTNKQDYLPSRIVAAYSGEETRWKDMIFDDFYKKFKNNIIKSNTLDTFNQPLLYVDKHHRDISLITLLYSTLEGNRDFIQQIFGEIDNIVITFGFDTTKLNNYSENTVISKLKQLNPQGTGTITLNQQQLRDAFVGYEIELFMSLLSAKEGSIIISVDVLINSIGMQSLSEGQKKLFLIKTILEFLTDEKSLIILDEPDSHIHIARKSLIKDIISEYRNRQIVMTTHSPTLMHCFDQVHVKYIENGEHKGNERLQILKDISGDIMSYTEQQIVLNTTKDILIVEGKTDEIYIKTALEKLQEDNPQYRGLDFEFLLMGGSDADILQRFAEQFPAKSGQKIMAFFDRDDAGLKCIKKALGNEALDKESFVGQQLQDIHINFYPKKDEFTRSNFEIEDYFPINTCRDFLYPTIQTFENLKQKFKKNDFANHCSSLDTIEFKGFKILFDKILEIKSS